MKEPKKYHKFLEFQTETETGRGGEILVGNKREIL